MNDIQLCSELIPCFSDPFSGCSMDCRHVYEKAVILHYIVNNPNGNCPVAGIIVFAQNVL